MSFTDDASNTETLTSAATAVVSAAANNLATGAPTITGTAQVGQTLTADGGRHRGCRTGCRTPFVRTLTPATSGSRLDGGTETNIASATASTYTLVAADHWAASDQE